MATGNHLNQFQWPPLPPPGWAEVAASVSSLDGAKRPLFTFAPDGAPAEGCMSVQGRPGAYTLAANLSGHGRFRYFDPDKGGAKEVLIFSDELLRNYASERYICADLSMVLELVRYFWRNGELHPIANWEKV
jgi:hypothetical protein